MCGENKIRFPIKNNQEDKKTIFRISGNRKKPQPADGQKLRLLFKKIF